AQSHWWIVSFLLHSLVCVLAGLITLSVRPAADDVQVICEREMMPDIAGEKGNGDGTQSIDIPPADPVAVNEPSDIIVPPDILVRSELGDHFETNNPDRRDTH